MPVRARALSLLVGLAGCVETPAWPEHSGALVNCVVDERTAEVTRYACGNHLHVSVLSGEHAGAQTPFEEEVKQVAGDGACTTKAYKLGPVLLPQGTATGAHYQVMAGPREAWGTSIELTNAGRALTVRCVRPSDHRDLVSRRRFFESHLCHSIAFQAFRSRTVPPPVVADPEECGRVAVALDGMGLNSALFSVACIEAFPGSAIECIRRRVMMGHEREAVLVSCLMGPFFEGATELHSKCGNSR